MTAKIQNSPRMMDAFELIAQERIHQKRMLAGGQILFNCDSPVVDDHRKLRVLMEEVGEVADAIERLEKVEAKKQQKGDTGQMKAARIHLRAELIQIAAVAIAWLETENR
ncbi:MAG TPA: hypothetical protein VHG71_02195 [Verrucomicrobiae bacterium]|nr:hypothetical protein [Verrucomicrobiae bacterium]